MSDGVAMRRLGYTGASYYFSLPQRPPFSSMEWVSRLTEMLLFVAHHLSLPALIEIHPGDTRNSVDDIVNAVRFIQRNFHSEFDTCPLILLENRTEQFLSTGHQLASFATRIAQEDDLKSTIGIVLDIQQLFTRTKGNFLDELHAIPLGPSRVFIFTQNTGHLLNLIRFHGGMSYLG